MAKQNSALIWLGIGAVVLYAVMSSSPADAASSNGTASEVSNQQFGLIQNNESFSSTPYKDGSHNGIQLYSIGFGHQIQPGEEYLLQGIDEPTASQLLMSDIQKIVDAINNTGVQFTQNQLDATTDLGMSGIQASLDLINIYNSQGDQAVRDWLPGAYVHWHPVPGGPAQVNQSLVNRRLQELATWSA